MASICDSMVVQWRGLYFLLNHRVEASGNVTALVSVRREPFPTGAIVGEADLRKEFLAVPEPDATVSAHVYDSPPEGLLARDDDPILAEMHKLAARHPMPSRVNEPPREDDGKDVRGMLKYNGVNVSGLRFVTFKDDGTFEASPTDPLPQEVVGRMDLVAEVNGNLYAVEILKPNLVRSIYLPGLRWENTAKRGDELLARLDGQ